MGKSKKRANGLARREGKKSNHRRPKDSPSRSDPFQHIKKVVFPPHMKTASGTNAVNSTVTYDNLKISSSKRTGVYYDDESFVVEFEGNVIATVLNASDGRKILEEYIAKNHKKP